MLILDAMKGFNTGMFKKKNNKNNYCFKKKLRICHIKIR